MWFERLSLGNFRGFSAAEWCPEPGVNLVVGGNGAGKTTLLEAMHLLANGRSFRGRVHEGLIKQGHSSLEVFGEWREGSGRQRRAGLRHSGKQWQALLDSKPVASIAELCSALAVLSFEPGSHSLIVGASEQRRRFVDWGLFHVEQEFIGAWRRYARALKQRNALLKSRPRAELLRPWDLELAEAGEPVTRMRALYVAQLDSLLSQTAAHYLPELGALRFRFLPGWPREDLSLGSALEKSTGRDLVLGHTSVGSHRDDWSIEFERLPGRDALSRGQQKLVALSCVLAQGHAYSLTRGEWPVVALDDLASELDHAHQHRVLCDLASCEAQILITGTEAPQALATSGLRPALFHVEQGGVRRLVQ
jgi:DNA replication and repair protein RecF